MSSSIDKYLEGKESDWSPQTVNSVRAALNSASPYLTGDPEVLWGYLKDHAPYTRAIMWQRICQYWDFFHKENPYREFKKANKKLFKNCYLRRKTSETVKEARTKIESITDPAIKRKALELLFTGMRWRESSTLCDGVVIGKGNKQREVTLPKIEGPIFTGHYSTFLRTLKDVGLTPHLLRKIYLSEFVDKGANPFELMEVAGWSSLQTSLSYIQANIRKIKSIQKDIIKGSK